jgi:hypothetical protein
MWALQYANRKCDQHERFRDHRMFLQRIITKKPVVNNRDEPLKPLFLSNRAKKGQMEAGKIIFKERKKYQD